MNFKQEKETLKFFINNLENLISLSDEAEVLLEQTKKALEEVENADKLPKEKLAQFKKDIAKKIKGLEYDLDGLIDSLTPIDLN